jgi:hypothetical protein
LTCGFQLKELGLESGSDDDSETNDEDAEAVEDAEDAEVATKTSDLEKTEEDAFTEDEVAALCRQVEESVHLCTNLEGL